MRAWIRGFLTELGFIFPVKPEPKKEDYAQQALDAVAANVEYQKHHGKCHHGDTH